MSDQSLQVPTVLADGGVAAGAPWGTPRDRSSRQSSFMEVLGRQFGLGLSDRPIEERARAGAEQLVAVALVQPLLKQLRDTSQAAPPFAPTSAEKQLRALQDADLARHVVHAGRFPLVERLAQRMLAARGEAAPRGVKGPP